jgi:hypothetical protein
MDLVPPLCKGLPQFGRDDAAAAVRWIAHNADFHDFVRDVAMKIQKQEVTRKGSQEKTPSGAAPCHVH